MELRKAVREAGYDLVVAPENEDGDKSSEQAAKQHYRLLKRQTVTALILSAGLIVLSMTPLANFSWTGYAEGILATLVLSIPGPHHCCRQR